ncbi:unnamed protein product [Arctogadus glacialis]
MLWIRPNWGSPSVSHDMKTVMPGVVSEGENMSSIQDSNRRRSCHSSQSSGTKSPTMRGNNLRTVGHGLEHSWQNHPSTPLHLTPPHLVPLHMTPPHLVPPHMTPPQLMPPVVAHLQLAALQELEPVPNPGN